MRCYFSISNDDYGTGGDNEEVEYQERLRIRSLVQDEFRKRRMGGSGESSGFIQPVVKRQKEDPSKIFSKFL